MIARPLGLLRMVNAASRAYLARHGVPRSLDDLQRQEHRTIHFSTMLGARPYGWEYPDGDSYATLQLPGALHVNSAQTYEAAALAGLGLIQAPVLGIGRYLESGALVEILPDFGRRSLAVSLVVAHRRNLSRRDGPKGGPFSESAAEIHAALHLADGLTSTKWFPSTGRFERVSSSYG